MTRVLGISGSLRRDSYNTKLLRAAEELLLDDVEFVIWDGLKAVPPYDEDDTANPPAGVAELRDAIAGADAILFATPEYNASVPGQLKNAIDWASRPKGSAVLLNKPVAVVAASPGMFGAAFAQADLRKILKRAGARVLENEFAVPRCEMIFDEDGRLADEGVRTHLAEVVYGLLEELVPVPVPVAA